MSPNQITSFEHLRQTDPDSSESSRIPERLTRIPTASSHLLGVILKEGKV